MTDWRDGRKNLRRVAEQDVAAGQIITWLDVVLAADGAVAVVQARPTQGSARRHNGLPRASP